MRGCHLSLGTDLQPSETGIKQKVQNLNSLQRDTNTDPGSYLAGLQDVDLLFINSVSVLLQEAVALILYLKQQDTGSVSTVTGQSSDLGTTRMKTETEIPSGLILLLTQGGD